MKNIFVLVIALIFGSTAFAEADLNPNIFRRPVTPPIIPSATPPPLGSAPVKPPPPAGRGTTATREGSIPTMGGSINPGSQQGQQSQKSGAGSNAAIGGALMAAGAAMMANPPTMPPGVILMAMGMLAMMQSKEDKDAAGKSAATGLASNTNGGGAGTSETDGTSGKAGAVDGTGRGGFEAAKIKEANAKLGEAGYKMTEKGLTGPDGSFIPAKALDSPSSMAAAGISPQTIAAVQSGLSDAQGAAMSGARVSSVGVNTGGGGGGGSGAGVTEGDSSGYSASDSGGSNPFGLGADQKASLVAGKTVMFDGEPIGVRGQNIFDMVHTCYQKKRDGKHFIESEVDVATRSPASSRLPRK